MQEKEVNEIADFYDRLKQMDSAKRTLESELEGRRYEIINHGILYYIMREIKRFLGNNINSVLNAGGDLGIDLILLRENGINIENAYSLDVFLPQYQNDFPKYVKGSIYNLTEIFKEQKFDLVILKEVLEHLFDPDRAIEELKSVTKSGGYIIITTPNLSSIINRILLLFGYLPMSYEVSTRRVFGKPRRYNYREGAAGHIRIFTFKAIREFLEFYGFEINNIYTFGASPSDVVSEKSAIIKMDRFFSKINKKWGSSMIIVAKKI